MKYENRISPKQPTRTPNSRIPDRTHNPTMNNIKYQPLVELVDLTEVDIEGQQIQDRIKALPKNTFTKQLAFISNYFSKTARDEIWTAIITDDKITQWEICVDECGFMHKNPHEYIINMWWSEGCSPKKSWISTTRLINIHSVDFKDVRTMRLAHMKYEKLAQNMRFMLRLH